ncbi:hypothetical protein ACFQV2_39215 [Actinokineospora soli]|uniref:Uncharacterized protein n=1 Tax=Actinokineospora soli TaxID=1048753 RepID=A0ABW2TX47_9PSEU
MAEQGAKQLRLGGSGTASQSAMKTLSAVVLMPTRILATSPTVRQVRAAIRARLPSRSGVDSRQSRISPTDTA